MEFSVGQLRSALTLAGLSKEEVKNISGKKALVIVTGKQIGRAHV